ncbi:hypothetical protein AB0P07_11975 [Streptomyces sp. NPDC085944]|uniref:hypothetical protein n=1 Tax=Streptomyces sp. NPDC085944 TaxID=3154962 RepID=UPI0034272D13
MIMSLALAAVGALLIGTAVIAFATGRIQRRQLWAGLALGNVSYLIANVLDGHTITAGFSAGGVALCVWMWWISGDGTRRRLRDLARRFQGVRRTAPAGGTA